MRRVFLVFGLLTLLFGCKKDEIDYNFPIVLISTEYKITSELKLYTKSGQITDDLVISNYLASDTFGMFYSRIDTTLEIIYADTVIYEYHDTVLFSDPGLWGKRIPENTGDYIFFYLTDTLIGFKSTHENSALQNVINQIGIHKPYYGDYPPNFYPPSTIYQRVYNAKIAKGTPRRLEFPLLTYKLSRVRDNYRAGEGRMNYNNVFDNNVINLLESGDTLAIQEAKIVYKAL